MTEQKILPATQSIIYVSTAQFTAGQRMSWTEILDVRAPIIGCRFVSCYITNNELTASGSSFYYLASNQIYSNFQNYGRNPLPIISSFSGSAISVNPTYPVMYCPRRDTTTFNQLDFYVLDDAEAIHVTVAPNARVSLVLEIVIKE